MRFQDERVATETSSCLNEKILDRCVYTYRGFLGCEVTAACCQYLETLVLAAEVITSGDNLLIACPSKYTRN
jgi:hypothetical protein